MQSTKDTVIIPTGEVPSNACIEGKPECYLVIHNISKRNNFGTLVRSAVAFGAVELLIVGCPHLRMFGDQGTRPYIKVNTEFAKCSEAREYLKARGVHICGIEIMPQAQSIAKHPWNGPTAFVLGNEGSGMSDASKEICDSFVYIPQHSMGVESLNVAVAGSIVLQHFAIWAQYQEAPRQETDNEKYVRQRIQYDIHTRSDNDRARQQQRAADSHSNNINCDSAQSAAASLFDTENDEFE